MSYDAQKVAEAIRTMREALALLDEAGAGATNCAFHLSLARDVADKLTGGNEPHDVEPIGLLGVGAAA